VQNLRRGHYDASGAMASRFVILVTTESFLGREDKYLTDKLLAELPGIFAWALDGLDSLAERGKLIQPASSDEAMRELQELASPVRAFINERCLVGDQHEVLCSALYAAWRKWCAEIGRDYPGNERTFGRDLRAVEPKITIRRPRRKGGRGQNRHYVGIGIDRSGCG
jgi:putative DNA primase/helicase